MLGLAWEDVDLENQQAYIAWHLQRVLAYAQPAPDEDAVLGRAAALPDICVRALEQRRVLQNRQRLAAGDTCGDCGLVLTTKYGDPLDPRNFHRQFKERCEAAGVPVISVHSTRRTCASLLVALDVHPRIVMAVLRHSKIALTMEIYSQVSSASTRDALKRLGSQLTGSS